MAYIKTNYPEFQDIRVAHFDGFDPKVVLEKVLTFLTDPAHATYRLINTHVDYLMPKEKHTALTTDPEASHWVDVSILYTE